MKDKCENDTLECWGFHTFDRLLLYSKHVPSCTYKHVKCTQLYSFTYLTHNARCFSVSVTFQAVCDMILHDAFSLYTVHSVGAFA